MIDIIVDVPSRGRPHNIVRLINEWEKTTSHKSLLHVIVDADDPTLEDYLAIPAPEFMQLTVQSENRGLNAVSNAAAVEDAKNCWIVGNMGDDHLPRTKDWDLRIIEALWGQSGVAYGDDLLQGENLPTAAFLTADLVRLLGFYAPPTLTHLMIDVFWLHLGRATFLVYLPDVIIEHMHPANGKGEFDDGYAEWNSPLMVQRDGAAWIDYLDRDWPRDLKKLRNAYMAPRKGHR